MPEGSDEVCTLPFSVDVILHDSRCVSTGVQLKCICPDQVRLIEYNEDPNQSSAVPDYSREGGGAGGTVLLFPGEGSIEIGELGVRLAGLPR